MEAFENTPESELPRFIWEHEKQRLDAVRDRNVEALRHLLADGFTFVRATGELILRDEYLERIENGQLDYGSEAEFRYQQSYQERDLYFVIGLLSRYVEKDGHRWFQRLRSSATSYRHEVGWQTLLLVHTDIADDVDLEITPGPERRIRVQ